MKKKKLAPKQAAFVNEYLIDLNATQAAIRAGYSKRTAKSIGQRLLTFVDVQSALQKAQDARVKRTEINQDSVLENIVRIGEKAEGADRYADALKAQEMLAKHVKLFSDAPVNNVNFPPVLQIIFPGVINGDSDAA